MQFSRSSSGEICSKKDKSKFKHIFYNHSKITLLCTSSSFSIYTIYIYRYKYIFNFLTFLFTTIFLKVDCIKTVTKTTSILSNHQCHHQCLFPL